MIPRGRRTAMVFTLVLALGEMLAAEPALVPAKDEVALRAVLAAQAAAPQLTRVDQLTNPRTGVTCTMRILRAEPKLDPNAMPSKPVDVDPDIRGRRVSPCVD